MTKSFSVLLRGGQCVLPEGIKTLDIGIKGEKIAEIGNLRDASAEKVWDVSGLHLLPGLIDPQVHFRDPGFPLKEDFESGTRGAVLGGITSVFEMPNTLPPTVSKEAYEKKWERALGKIWCDLGLFVGATPDNAEQLAELERLPGCPGVKMFMGKSTGNLLVHEEKDLHRVLSSGSRRIAVHAEDEERLLARRKLVRAGDPSSHPLWRDEESAFRATHRLLKISREYRRPVHVLHITTEEEIELLRNNRELATFECTPQHLTLTAPECYRDLGTFAQMNPPIRERRHKQALWQAVTDGLTDALGSDHAPHTIEEKRQPYPESPAGMTGVQTLVPIMLDHVNKGKLSLQRLVSLCATGPATIYGLKHKGFLRQNFDADITVIDLKKSQDIQNDQIASKCGWTPFNGQRVTGWPVGTIIRGSIVMREGQLMGEPSGLPVEFSPQPLSTEDHS